VSLNIKLKRSAVLGSAPTAAQLEDGEIGVNYNVGDPALYIKNSAGAVIRLAGTNAITDLWIRNGTTISPADAGDDIEIGGGNIELNSNGSIDATGNIKTTASIIEANADPYQGANTGTQLRNGTFVASTVNPSDSIFLGYVTGSSSNTIKIAANGSILTDGSINSGDAPYAGAGTGTFLSPSGVFRASAVSGSPLWQGYLNGTTGATSSITSQGTATFSGGVTAQRLDIKSNVSSGGGVVFAGYDGNDTRTFITDDQGTTQIGGTLSSTTAANTPNIELNSGGAINAKGNIKTTASIIEAKADPYLGANTGTQLRNSTFVASGATTNYIYLGYTTGNSTSTISFTANGNATFSGTVTATVVPPSDARFKDNITPANPQLADIVALGGLLKNYDWNDKAPLSNELRSQRQLGLIAQEVEKVCPSITKTIHRTRTVETKPAVTDDEGAVVTEAVTKEVDESYKGISQDALIMKLLGAVAELSAEVEALKSIKRKK